MGGIVLQNLCKIYPGGFQAVKGVSLSVPEGAFCVLVGPSGCGKSTTLRMVAGLEEISDGQVSIGGRVVNNVHPKDRDIAMVFQNYALYPHMSVYDNMAFALKMRRLPRNEIERRVHAAAETLGLAGMLGRKPAALSGGQRQRVAVGRAIVREPKAFLFDEPLSNLDAKLRVSTRAEIKALQLRLKTTTMYVTHDQEEAMSLADVMVIMAGGIVQQVGEPMDLYRRPANRFVGGFVGTPAMNMLDGTIRSGGAGQGIEFVALMKDLSGKPCALRLSDAHARALSGRVGLPAVLGVRPQAIRVAASPRQNACWSLRAGVVEAMGDHSDVYLSGESGVPIVARTQTGVSLEPGATVNAWVEAAAVHVFEPGEFGLNLTLGE